MLADSHNILSGWNHYFTQLLNLPRVNSVRQIEIPTSVPLVLSLILLRLKLLLKS